MYNICLISIEQGVNPRTYSDPRPSEPRHMPYLPSTISEKEDTDSMLSALRRQLQPHLVMALRQGSPNQGGLFAQIPQVSFNNLVFISFFIDQKMYLHRMNVLQFYE